MVHAAMVMVVLGVTTVKSLGAEKRIDYRRQANNSASAFLQPVTQRVQRR